MLAQNTEGRIIGLTGYAQSGKDSVGRYLIERHGFTRVSFADSVRESIYTLDPIVHTPVAWRISQLVDLIGWERAKTEHAEVRRLLQVMGTEVGRMLFGNNVWVDIADRKRQIISGPVVFTDVRFENEADYVQLNGGSVWWVYRAGVGPINAHVSDQIDFPVDLILPNDGTLDDLYARVDSSL